MIGDRYVRFAVALLLLAILATTFLFAVSSANAKSASDQEVTCWWVGTKLHAIGLPDKWSITANPVPTGVTAAPAAIAWDFGFTFTAYFWTRGGPYEALFKPGRQLNDYKPICVAVP